MNKQKQTYLSPETETLVVRFEGSILTGSELGGSGFNEQGNVKDTDTSGWGW